MLCYSNIEMNIAGGVVGEGENFYYQTLLIKVKSIPHSLQFHRKVNL